VSCASAYHRGRSRTSGVHILHITNPRTRFYFTEAGWQKYGRQMYAAARQRGHTIRIIRRKNPAKSQIVYQDAYQVALLPGRARR
jgi:hypothetical protein